jgi:hypothetical protein
MTLVLVAAAIAPFATTLAYPLVWDDHYILNHVEQLAAGGGVAKVVSAPFFPQEDRADTYYRPLVYFSLWLDSRVAALAGAPWPYHLTNVLLHAAVALLVALLAHRLGGGATAGFAAGLLFAVHPARVESVAFVSGRTDIWAAFFALCAVLAALDAVRRADRRRRALLVGFGCAAVGAACLSKEAAFALPGVVAALGLVAPDLRRRCFVVALGYALAAAAVLAVRLLVLGVPPGAHGGSPAPLLLHEPGIALVALAKMLRMALVPWPHNALIGREHLVPATVDVVVAVALVAGLAWFGKRRLGLFGLVWLFAFLTPALFVPASGHVLAAERYLYLPSIGVFVVVGVAFARWLDELPASRRPLAGSALAFVALALGAGALVRGRVWQSDLTISTDLTRTAPGTALSHSVHGQALLAAGRFAEAVAAFERAVELAPDHPGTHNDLAIGLWRLGLPARSAAAYRETLRLDPTRASARQGLAYACHVLGDVDCVREQREALSAADPAALRELDAAIAGR